jgi:hypothetical protein
LSAPDSARLCEKLYSNYQHAAWSSLLMIYWNLYNEKTPSFRTCWIGIFCYPFLTEESHDMDLQALSSESESEIEEFEQSYYPSNNSSEVLYISFEVLEVVKHLDLDRKKNNFRYLQKLVRERNRYPYGRLHSYVTDGPDRNLQRTLQRYAICCLEQLEHYLFRLIQEEDPNFPFYLPTQPREP